jgi:hypothetical protein
MKSNNILKENTHEEYFSGSVKISTDYVSKFKLVDACFKIAEKHPEFLQLRVRAGGGGDLAIDFLMEGEDMDSGLKHIKNVLQEFLGDDYIKGYDMARGVVVIK